MTEAGGAAPLSCRLSNKEPTCAAPLVGPAVTLEFELTALPAPLNCFLGAQFWGVIHNLSPKSDLESQVGGWDWELWGKFTGARVAQWIRRRSPKPKIGGSSPPVGTNTFTLQLLFSGYAYRGHNKLKTNVNAVQIYCI